MPTNSITMTCLIPKDFIWDHRWGLMLSTRWQGVLDWYERELQTKRLNADWQVYMQQAPWTLREMRERTNNPEQGNMTPTPPWKLFQAELEKTAGLRSRVNAIIVVGASGYRGAWHSDDPIRIGPYSFNFRRRHFFAVGDIVFTGWLSAFPDSGVSKQISAFWPGWVETIRDPDAMSGIVAHELSHNVSDYGEHVCDKLPGQVGDPPLYCLGNLPYEWPQTVMGPTIRNKILARPEFVVPKL